MGDLYSHIYKQDCRIRELEAKVERLRKALKQVRVIIEEVKENHRRSRREVVDNVEANRIACNAVIQSCNYILSELDAAASAGGEK